MPFVNSWYKGTNGDFECHCNQQSINKGMFSFFICLRFWRSHWKRIVFKTHGSQIFISVFEKLRFHSGAMWTQARGVHLTRFWSGTCHRGFKNIPVPYTNFLKKYTRSLYQFFEKVYPTLYFIPNLENRYPSLYQNYENWYRSLYQYLENRYPSRWHVPVPEIYVVHPPGNARQKRRNFTLFSYENGA